MNIQVYYFHLQVITKKAFSHKTLREYGSNCTLTLLKILIGIRRRNVLQVLLLSEIVDFP